jgi:membrane associated rhomboid family serine protease
MNFWEKLKYNWNVNSSAIKKLIYINIAFFIVAVLCKLIFHLYGYSATENSYFTNPILEKLVLYSAPGSLLTRPWSLVSYMFMHSGFMHILFNMLILFFIGRIAEDFYSPNDIYKQYIFGGIAGAILFILAYNIFPIFTRMHSPVPMIGASAAVIAIVVATAAWVPNYEVFLWGVVRLKLKWLALIMVGLDIIMFTNGNEGGRISHIGGAAFGFLYAQKRSWFDFSFQLPSANIFKRKTVIDERKIFRGVPKQHQSLGKINKPNQDEVDAILDKISQSGYSSLSKEEKEILFRASDKDLS